MDPITIIGTAGAVANIVDVVSKTINSLRELRNRWKDANLAIFNLIVQLTTLKAALNRICEWISSDLEDIPQHHQLVMDLQDSVACCRMLVQTMDNQIADLVLDEANGLDLPSKIKVVFETKISEDFQKYIDRQTSALNLLLTACNCNSISEQKALLEKSMSREVFDQVKDDSSSLIVLHDTASSFSRRTQSTGTSSKISKVFPSLDEELAGTPVYQRAVRSLFKRNLRRQKPTTTSPLTPLAVDAQSKFSRSDQITRSKSIDAELLADRSKMRRQCSVLLLGDADKELVWTQLKLIAPESLTQEALLSFKSQVISIMFDGIDTLLKQLDSRNLTSEQESCKVRTREVHQQHAPSLHIDLELREEFRRFWWMFSHVLDADLASAYFLNHLHRIATPEYIPVEADILHIPSRQHMGIQEVIVPFGESTLKIFTPGQMMGERKKWMHQGEMITALAFVVDLCSYDTVSPMEDEVSQLDETIALFASVVSSPWFKRRSVILFFNNIDQFKQKIQTSPLIQRFPSYDGGNDVERAKDFMLGLFQSASAEDLEIYMGFINPGDNRAVPTLRRAVMDIVIGQTLKTLGFPLRDQPCPTNITKMMDQARYR